MDLEDGCISVTIPRTDSRIPSRFLSRPFTVYEIRVSFHFSSYKIQRRYRQFCLLKQQVTLIQLPLEVTNRLPEFPAKNWIQKSHANVVGERRIKLEAWLQQSLAEPQVILQILNFLEVPIDKKTKVMELSRLCNLTGGDRCVAALVSSLHENERHKSRAIEEFEKNFFAIKQGMHGSYVRLLLRVLAPLCGNQVVACKSLDVLYKLLSSASYRYYEMVVTQLLDLDLNLLQGLRLDLHILKQFQGDSSETALAISKLLYDHFSRQMQESIFKYILYEDPNAYEVFNKWLNQEIPKSPQSKRKKNRDWVYLDTTDQSGELTVRYKTIQKCVELYSSIIVECSYSKVVSLLTDIKQIKRWNFFIKEGREIEVITPNKKVLVIMMRYETQDLEFCFDVEKFEESEDTTLIHYTCADHPNAPEDPDFTRGFLDKRVFTIQRLGEMCDMNTRSFEEELDSSDDTEIRDSISSTESTESYSSTETEGVYQFRISCLSLMKFSLAKLIYSEFLGENRTIIDSWNAFKNIAEEVKIEETERPRLPHVNSILESLDRKIPVSFNQTPKRRISGRSKTLLDIKRQNSLFVK